MRVVFFSLLLLFFSPLTTFCQEIRWQQLNVLCEKQQYIQLGVCSPFFIECRRNGAARIVQCPVREEIFSRGRCLPASRDCHDSSVSFLNEETTKMAQQEQICGSGTGFSTGETCSRQALVCRGGQSIAVACPTGYILNSSDLSCIPSTQQCYGQSSTAIKDFLLLRLCTSQNLLRSAGHQEQKCTTWYVTCQPRPTVVRCPSDSIYDWSIHRCRPWQQGDRCLMAGMCYGREYMSISLGKCQSVYLYCDGHHAKYLHCSQGMIFNGKSCVPVDQSSCPICSNSQTRPSSSCNKYFECSENRWNERECPGETAWNQEREKCEQNYACISPTTCRKGTIILVSCGKALICNGYGFDEISCPPNMMFDQKTLKCVYHAPCNPRPCREGDVILSPDCTSYRICNQNTFKFYKCQGANSHYCKNCQNGYEGGQSYPGKCSKGQTQADHNNCSVYYICKKGMWNGKRCPAGQVWNSLSSSCVQPEYGRGCSSALESQCREGERILNPSATDCNRLLECQAARWVELELTCPIGYIYDAKNRNCVPGQCPSNLPDPTVVPGGSGSAQPPAPPPVDDGYGVSCMGNEKTVDPFDCSKYMVCRNGQMVSQICPSGNGYNPRTHECQSGYCRSQCEEGITFPLPVCGQFKVCYNGKFISGRCNLDKAFENGKCIDRNCTLSYYIPDCVDGAVMPPQQSNPSVFMVCINGRWMERTCGSRYVFNYEKMICEQQTEGPMPPPKCYGGDTRSIHDSCQEYELCNYGTWMKQRCPHGYKFSYRVCVPGKCEGEEEEQCLESADGYRRDAYDCSKYYQCVHGKWMQRPCARDTVFNERLLVCDHRTNVPECRGY